MDATPKEFALGAHIAESLQNISDLFITLDREFRVRFVNQAWERSIGRSRDDVVGRSLWELFPYILGTKFESGLQAAMQTGLPQVFEEYASGLDAWYQVRAFPGSDGLTLLILDITGRRRDESTRGEMEQKLFQAQRMESLGTLAGGIAHDFNNILAAILGHVGLLREQVEPGSAVEASVLQIGQAGERARDLVRGILTFSRTADRVFIAQSLRPLVEESLRLLRHMLPASVSLNVTLTGKPLVATVNPTEVQQLLVNLCTNAWQALPDERGAIDIGLSRVRLLSPKPADVGSLFSGEYALLKVHDAGSGIAAEARKRLFEPFFTTKVRGKGTGLGLHVVHGIVIAHAGAIVVESTPGAGTTFSVYIPVSDAALEGGAAVEAPRRVLGTGQRVAYIDDDEVVLVTVELILERAGFQVSAFGRPEAFLEALEADPHAFDLLVTDYEMPVMNGLTVARAARDIQRRLPIVVSTGFVSEELLEAAIEVGITDILHKEKTYEELGQLVVDVLERTSFGESTSYSTL